MIDVDFSPAGLMPEGAIPTGVFTLVTWLEPSSGEMSWTFWQHFELPISSILGYLEMAKMDLMTRWFTPSDED